MIYNKYTLKELATIRYGKNQKNVVSSDGSFPIYGTGGLMGYASKYLYDKPSVLIGRKGTIDKVRYVTHPFWTVDTLFYTEINDAIVIPHFLYYVLSLLDMRKYNEGTSIPSLRTETLNRLELYIPPLSEQKKILSFIEPIEEKIDINSRINRNLSEQAAAIYKAWFINFEMNNGICPDDWTDGVLGDIAEIASGKRPPMKQNNKTDDVCIPLVGAASIMGYTNTVLYDSKILVTGRVGTHGVIQRFNQGCWPSDNTLVITTDRYEFVNQILLGVDYKSMNRGSTQPLITQGDLKKIILPNDAALDEFENLAGGLMSQYEKNVKENAKLSELRDSLLPKLMSGELEVSEIDF